jgi:hypothetical protein
MNTILKLKEDRKLQYIVGGSAIAALLAFYAIYRFRNSHKTPIND